MPRVHLLLRGEHDHDHPAAAGVARITDPITSSVTLIQGNTLTIVDTGTPAFASQILEALSYQGIDPKAVNYVIITHRHSDHWLNVGLFPNAQVVTERGNLITKGARAVIHETPQRNMDWEIFETPGHTDPHVSVRVYGSWNGAENRTIMIAGDAIREDKVRAGYYKTHRQERDSALWALRESDVVIPGHYDVIEGDTIPELRDLLLSS